MLTEWNINNSRRGYMVTDGAGECRVACQSLNLPQIHCFLHQLHLVVTDAIKTQALANRVIQKAKAFHTHIAKSQPASNLLKQVQIENGKKPNDVLYPVNDTENRWNSTYLMLERLFILKPYLLLLSGLHNMQAAAFPEYEWKMVENLLILLKPFFEVTKIVSASKCTLSDVAIHAVALRMHLLDPSTGVGVLTMKDALLVSLENRYFNCDPDPHDPTHIDLYRSDDFMIATALDARYKLTIIKDQNLKDSLKRKIVEKVKSICRTETREQGNVPPPGNAAKEQQNETEDDTQELFRSSNIATRTKGNKCNVYSLAPISNSKRYLLC